MSDFLENQKKKQQENLPEDPETPDLPGEVQEEPNQMPGPGPEEPKQLEVDDPSEIVQQLEDELYEEQQANEKLQKENLQLQEKIAELSGEGGTEGEGWLGPHEAAALQEEVQMLKVKVQNQNQTIQRLNKQVRVGKR